jgi:hypothetical protein
MNVQIPRDRFRELRIGIAGEHHQAVVGHVNPSIMLKYAGNWLGR